MTTNLYRDLAKIQAQRKELEAKEAQIKLQIIDGMEASGELQVVTQYGKATLSTKTSYEYSDKIKSMADKLKTAQVKEVQKGLAKPKITKYLTFTIKTK